MQSMVGGQVEAPTGTLRRSSQMHLTRSVARRMLRLAREPNLIGLQALSRLRALRSDHIDIDPTIAVHNGSRGQAHRRRLDRRISHAPRRWAFQGLRTLSYSNYSFVSPTVECCFINSSSPKNFLENSIFSWARNLRRERQLHFRLRSQQVTESQRYSAPLSFSL
jgi:hypothetical protein